jgi:hypothetical protein
MFLPFLLFQAKAYPQIQDYMIILTKKLFTIYQKNIK